MENQIFGMQALSWDPLAYKKGRDNKGDVGYFPQENGDIFFRLNAPSKKKLILRIGGKVDIEFKIAGEGFVEGTFPYRDENTGPHSVDVMIDGVPFITPDLPVFWTGNHPKNYIEVPDSKLSFAHLKDVPHGSLNREIYWSDALKRWERCLVYTPAAYQENSDDYPVLYLLNGGGDNEVCWEHTGRMSAIMDNLLSDKSAVPFIVVTINSMLRYPNNDVYAVDDACEKTMVENLIPFIDSKYRTRTDKWNRAVAGLSMGAYMTNDIGLMHPELFGSIGQFTASMTTKVLKTSYPRPYHTVLKEGAEKFAEKYHLFFRSTTPAEDHLDYYEADDELYKKAGISELPCYHRLLYPARTSKWNSWRMGLRDFAQLLFR